MVTAAASTVVFGVAVVALAGCRPAHGLHADESALLEEAWTDSKQTSQRRAPLGPRSNSTVIILSNGETSKHTPAEWFAPNLSGAGRQVENNTMHAAPVGFVRKNETKVDAQMQIKDIGASTSDSAISQKYAGPALEAMKRAVQSAEKEDAEAKARLEKASSAFHMARDVQAKADRAAKDALDAEAVLIDGKAAALRSVAVGKEMMSAAAKASMGASLAAQAKSGNATATLKQEEQAARATVQKAERSLAAVRVKLLAAEKATAAAHAAAAHAANRTDIAYRELDLAKGLSAKATTRRELLDEQVALKAEQIARLAEALTQASETKVKAFEEYEKAKKELADAVHLASALKHVPEKHGATSKPNPPAASKAPHAWPLR